MILRLITGQPSEATEKDVAEKLATATERGVKVHERLSTTHYDTSKGLMIYSLWFTKKGKSTDPLKSRFDFVPDPTDTELELMKCKNARNVNHKQREVIEKSGITFDDACKLSRFYAVNKKLPTTEQNSKGMKRTFDTMVNNLTSQVEIASEWSLKASPRVTVIDEPSWAWRDVRDEYIDRGELDYRGKEWSDLTKQQQGNIQRLQPR